MKKVALSIVSVVLLLTLLCSSAFALTGDITVKEVKAYADPAMKVCIGTIPKLTSVFVRAYGAYADVIVNGKECYINPSALTMGKHDYDYVGVATLRKGAQVFQRPSKEAKNLSNTDTRKVYVYRVNKGVAMIRTNSGVFGFVDVNDLNDIRSN